MARTYAQLYTGVWTDPDWCALTLAEQAVYDMLLRQPRLNLCGVIDYLPARWRDFTGSPAEEFDTALAGLEAKRYVVIDHATSELLIRTFVKWEHQAPSITQVSGLWNAYATVLSPRLREEIVKHLPSAVWAKSKGPKVPLPEGLSAPPTTPPDRASDTPSDTPWHLPEPEPEPEPEQQQQPARETPDADSDPPPPDPAAAAAAAIEALADLELDERIAAGLVVKNRRRYRQPIADDLHAERHHEALELAHQHPDWTPDQLAAALAERRQPPDTPPAWRPDPTCSHCHGQPWIIHNGQAYRCPACYPADLPDPRLPDQEPAA